MESTDSSTITPPCPPLPPGFRFHPTDEELIVHYLARKAASAPLPVSIIAEVDLYKFDPWELPSKATFGENEWYFFSPRERKYPNGARPNRAATSGYWKATGTDKPIVATTTSSDGRRQKVGVKKALVFYGGKPPRGIKTEWIMHEFRLLDNSGSATAAPKAPQPGPGLSSKRTGSSLRLDAWVLCRIYKKNNVFRPTEEHLHHPHHLFLGRSFPCAATFFDGAASAPPEIHSVSDHFRIHQAAAKQPHLMGSDHQHYWDDEMASTSTAAPGSVDTDRNSGGGGGSFVSLLNQLPSHSAPYTTNTGLLDPLGTTSFCDSHFSSPSTATWNS